jgi:hypothetical protein
MTLLSRIKEREKEKSISAKERQRKWIAQIALRHPRMCRRGRRRREEDGAKSVSNQKRYIVMLGVVECVSALKKKVAVDANRRKEVEHRYL